MKIKRKFAKGKKGFEVIGDLPTWLITALIILVFFFIFTIPGCATGAGKESSMNLQMLTDDLKLNYDLMTFLRRPAEVDGEKLIMADLVDAKLEIVNGYWPKYKQEFKSRSGTESEIRQAWIDEMKKPSLSDKVVFMGVEKTIAEHGELYQKYLKRAQKFDKITKSYFPEKYFECYELRMSRGNIVLLGEHEMTLQQVQPQIIAANSFQSHDGQNIVFQLRVSGYLYAQDGLQYCKTS